MYRFFLHIYQLIQKRKLPVFVCGIAIFAGLGLLASKLELKEDITELIPKNERSETLKKVLGKVEFSDKIVVAISTKNPENVDSLVVYANRFLDSVQQNSSRFVETIQGKVETQGMLGTYDFVYQHLPLFLDAEDYEILQERIRPDSVKKRVGAGYKMLLSPIGFATKKYVVKDPLRLTNMGLEKLKRLQVGDNFELYQNFLVTHNRKNLLLFLSPALPTNETDQNTVFVGNLKKTINNLNQDFKNVDALIFGSTLYAVANAKQIKEDIILTVSIAMGILLLILILFYRKLLVPLFLFLPTLGGALLALGFLSLFKGEISAISLGIGSILLGITLDYSLHVLTHSRSGVSAKQIFKDVSLPVMMSGFTTAVAFVCLLFVNSEALRDLGIFAAISVLGAAFFALVLIPQFYSAKASKQKPRTTLIDKAAVFDFHKNKGLLIGLALVFLLGVFFFNEVNFNNDLSSLNYQPKELVKAEKKLAGITDHGAKSIYLVAYGNSTGEVLSANNRLFNRLEAFKRKEKIVNFSSIGGLVLSTETQQKKIARWNEFWTAKKKKALKNRLVSTGLEIGYKKNAFRDFFELLEKDFEPIGLEEYQAMPNLFLEEFIVEGQELSTVVSVVKIDPEKSRGFLSQFKDNGQVLAIDREALNESFLGGLKNNFNRLIGYSTLAVFLILLFSYRNLELAIFTLLPIVATWTVVIATMDVFQLSFNIFNIMIATFVFGLGIDYSIFMTKGLRKKYGVGTNELPAFRTSIILSVITTLLGVGALIFAEHPALKSVALVSIIGILSAALVSFVLQPFVFNLFVTSRAKNGLSPLRLRETIHSILSFLYFGLGAFLLSTLSALIIPLFPVKKERKMLFFHRVLSKFMQSVLYTNPFVKKRILNLHGENFEKPCILIANHSSFLDILCVGMLHPKLIYLVNDWVYESPVFGKAVKLAGFYPVSEGIEGSVEHLRKKVEQGYSLIAFPEGSRSKTHKIRRFHKGAFYLAEKLELDILPVIIHGNANVLPKGDFVIHDGEITVEITKRIPWDMEKYGKSYSEKTKKHSKAFRSEFTVLQDELEKGDFHKKRLLSNYRYKTCYRRLKKEFDTDKDDYFTISKFIDGNDKVLQIGSQEGLWTYFLSYRQPRAEFIGIEKDTENLQISRNCFDYQRQQVSFSDCIPQKTDFNVLLISDKKEFELEKFKDYLTLHVKRVIILKAGLNPSQLAELGFEIELKLENLVVFKKVEAR